MAPLLERPRETVEPDPRPPGTSGRNIFQFEGQVTIFYPRTEPCYRCLYPEPSPLGEVPSCQEAPVLEVLLGIIDSLQALETIKLMLGIGRLPIGQLILFDARDMEFHSLHFARDIARPVCGESPKIEEPVPALAG